MRFPREHPCYRREVIDPLRIVDFHRLDASGETYLDYAGACPYPESLVMDHLWQLRDSLHGNPHSDSPASLRSTAALTRARAAVLEFFNADPDTYDVVFTANATAAMALVGAAYPFDDFLYTADAHNSLLGIREYARERKASIRYLPLNNQLRIPTTELLARLTLPVGEQRLLGFPAQCNFTGVQHPLEWIEHAHAHGWRVLVDAATFASTNTLDLSAHPADYVAVSWYKIFGYPTGIGSLIARHHALAALEQPSHAGGTTKAASVAADWYHLVAGAEGFEHGTVDYLAMPAVAAGCAWIRELGIEAIHDRVRVLTQWTIGALTQQRHSNGAPLVRIYGPLGMRLRGGCVAFNFLDPAGALIDDRVVSQAAGRWKISLRTGCFCAPGVGEAAFGLGSAQLAAAGELPQGTPLDDYLRALGMPTGGAIRISYGLASTAIDAERFIAFAESFIDQHPSPGDLPQRVHC
jgi:selenocysteine lyase/cysteine desulfurase